METMQTIINNYSEYSFNLLLLPVGGMVYVEKGKNEDEIIPVYHLDQRLLIFRRLGKSALVESPAG